MRKKQQIKFYKKSPGELIFSQATKNLKMIYFACPTDQVLKNEGYTTDLPDNLQSTAKLFANDKSLLSTVYDPNISVSNYFSWAYKWKMTFNPDLSKQAQEVTFSTTTFSRKIF